MIVSQLSLKRFRILIDHIIRDFKEENCEARNYFNLTEIL